MISGSNSTLGKTGQTLNTPSEAISPTNTGLINLPQTRSRSHQVFWKLKTKQPCKDLLFVTNYQQKQKPRLNFIPAAAMTALLSVEATNQLSHSG